MIVITTVDGKQQAIKSTEYYKNAEDLIKLLTNLFVIQVDYVESLDRVYILAKYIVSVQDV